MDIEDREAIEILEDIQREEIPKLSFFPVYDGKTFTDLDVKNKLVAHDVFGLPDEVFNKLDLTMILHTLSMTLNHIFYIMGSISSMITLQIF